MAATRSRGYSVSDEDVTPGIGAVGVPRSGTGASGGRCRSAARRRGPRRAGRVDGGARGIRGSTDGRLTAPILVRCTTCPPGDNLCDRRRRPRAVRARSDDGPIDDGTARRWRRRCRPTGPRGPRATASPVSRPARTWLRCATTSPWPPTDLPSRCSSCPTAPGISAETMGNALLIQFPDLRFERTLIPFISTVEEAREVVAQPRRGDGRARCTPLVFTTAAVDEVRAELHAVAVPDHRLLRHAHEPGRGDPRRPRAARGAPGCTASATSGATTPGWRRSSSPSSTTTGRACAALDRADVDPASRRPGAARRRPRCTWRCSTACSSPTTRWSTRTSRPPTCPRPVRDLRDRCFGLIDHAGPAQPGPQRAAARTRGTPRWSSAASSCAGPTAMYAAHRLPVDRLLGRRRSRRWPPSIIQTPAVDQAPQTADRDPTPHRGRRAP